MGIGVTGDFAKLNALTRRIAAVGSPALLRKAARVMGAEGLSLTQRGFRESTAPDGSPWAPLKHRSGKPLRDTGRLGSSFTNNVVHAGFRIGTNVSYASHHQGGTARIPARPMLPTSVMPEAWASALLEAARSIVSAELAGAAE